jgi:hypothetical protein
MECLVSRGRSVGSMKSKNRRIPAESIVSEALAGARGDARDFGRSPVMSRLGYRNPSEGSPSARVSPAQPWEVRFAKALAMSRSTFRWCRLACFAFVVFCCAASGQEPKQKGEKLPDPPTILAVKPAGDDDANEVRIHERLIVVIQDDDDWIPHTKVKNLVLFLNDRPIAKLPAQLNQRKIKDDKGQSKIQKELIFDLLRNKDTKESWDLLIGDFSFGPPKGEKFFGKDVLVSLGADAAVVVPGAQTIKLIPHSYFAWSIPGIVIVLVSFVFFVKCARKTDIVRDSGPEPRPGKRRPYSLGRCQMAFWFFLVLASANFVWWFTSDPASMIFPGSILALMGISSMTTLSALGVEITNPDSARLARINALRATMPSEATILAIQAKPAASRTAAEQATLAEVEEFDKLTASRGWKDLLFSDDSPALHRMQMIAWTLVLAVVFLFSVCYSLKMPDFDPSLLLLMGITNFTYVGFKVPENSRP